MGNAQRTPAMIQDLEEDDIVHSQETVTHLTKEEAEDRDILAEYKVHGKIDLAWSDSEDYAVLFNKLQPTASALLCKSADLYPNLHGKSISVKVAVLGKATVGKTSTILNCCGYDVPESHTETAGLQTTICHHPVKLSIDGQVSLLRFHFWDCGTLALQRYEYLRKSMLYDVDICLFCFSLQDKDSLDSLPKLIKNSNMSPDVVKIIVGTRLDQRYTLPYSERYLYESIKKMDLPFLRISNLPKSHLNNMGRKMRAHLFLVSLGFFCFFLLLGQKLDGKLPGWGWWQTFAPLWIMFALIFYLALMIAFRLRAKDSRERANLIINTHIVILIVPVIYALLLCSKLSGSLDAPFIEIFSPFFVVFGVVGLVIFFLPLSGSS